MRRGLIVIAAAAIGLAATTATNAGLLSATGAVIAILGGELFVGEAEGHLGGAGTLLITRRRIRASPAPANLLRARRRAAQGN